MGIDQLAEKYKQEIREIADQARQSIAAQVASYNKSMAQKRRHERIRRIKTKGK